MMAKTCSLPGLARLTLMKGSPFAVDGRWVVVVGDEVGGSDYCGWLWLWQGPGWGLFWMGWGVFFACPHVFLVVITGRDVRGCIDASFLAGCWSQE